MGLIKEPTDVDFSTESEPWTEQELLEFRKIMQEIKKKNATGEEKLLEVTKQNKKNVEMQQSK